MVDREALAAALNNDKPDEFTSVEAQYEVVATAARERLAQLPEKCQTCEGTHPFDLPGPICPTCNDTGKAYPAELVERIGATLDADHSWYQCTGSHDYPRLSRFVLDALNEETP